MKQLVIELENEMLEKLELVAPARSRKRSEFIRSAIRRALWELDEKATEAAYRKIPDSADDVYLDSQVWEAEDGRSGDESSKSK